MTCLDRISFLWALEQKWLKNGTPPKLRPPNRATADSWISKLRFTTVLGVGLTRGSQEAKDRIQKTEFGSRTPNPKLEGVRSSAGSSEIYLYRMAKVETRDQLCRKPSLTAEFTRA
jgi:hypothetical protein